ncbi:hypothetical protein R1flu_011929 [Riccia fluitans]|uniref:Uncharacterized protein n=1 Tax=Riccia fluitans TaxID=41844 RepID=A0ABD1ZDC1_9MARC
MRPGRIMRLGLAATPAAKSGRGGLAWLRPRPQKAAGAAWPGSDPGHEKQPGLAATLATKNGRGGLAWLQPQPQKEAGSGQGGLAWLRPQPQKEAGSGRGRSGSGCIIKLIIKLQLKL